MRFGLTPRMPRQLINAGRVRPPFRRAVRFPRRPPSTRHAQSMRRRARPRTWPCADKLMCAHRDVGHSGSRRPRTGSVQPRIRNCAWLSVTSIQLATAEPSSSSTTPTRPSEPRHRGGLDGPTSAPHRMRKLRMPARYRFRGEPSDDGLAPAGLSIGPLTGHPSIIQPSSCTGWPWVHVPLSSRDV